MHTCPSAGRNARAVFAGRAWGDEPMGECETAYSGFRIRITASAEIFNPLVGISFPSRLTEIRGPKIERISDESSQSGVPTLFPTTSGMSDTVSQQMRIRLQKIHFPESGVLPGKEKGDPKAAFHNPKPLKLIPLRFQRQRLLLQRPLLQRLRLLPFRRREPVLLQPFQLPDVPFRRQRPDARRR
jgi:hypothetical protein